MKVAGGHRSGVFHLQLQSLHLADFTNDNPELVPLENKPQAIYAASVRSIETSPWSQLIVLRTTKMEGAYKPRRAASVGGLIVRTSIAPEERKVVDDVTRKLLSERVCCVVRAAKFHSALPFVPLILFCLFNPPGPR